MPHAFNHGAARTLFALALLGTVGCSDFTALDTPPVQMSTHVEDWRDEVIYQVLVDRFDNADRGNDFLVNFDDLARHQGGDWAGLQNRLGYLEALGITTLWISPVVRNVETDANVDGYHGYWAQDMEATNPHFGDIVALRSLVDAAHARGMKVIFDIVTNHVGQAFFYDINLNGVADINVSGSGNNSPVTHTTEYDPDFDPRGVQAFTSLGEAGPAPVVFQWDPATNHVPPEPALYQDPAIYNRRGRTVNFEDPDQLLHGDFPGGLKDINTTRCDVKQSMVDIFAGWIERTDADGFRIDTLKHVEYEFWRYFTQRVRTRLADGGKDNFLMFGEVFDGRESLLSTFTRHEILGEADLRRAVDAPVEADPTDEQQLQAEQSCATDGQPITGDQVDSVFYFSQHFQAVQDVFTRAQSTNRIQALWESRPMTWGTEPNARGIGLAPSDVPINFLDNHDVARFLFNVRDEDREQQALLLNNALAFIITAQGIPCIYYGTEQDFAGGNDPANRERLWDTGFATTGDTFVWIQRLLAMRRAYTALRRGDVHVVWSTENTGEQPDAGIFAYERFGADAGGSYVLMVFNTHQSHASTPVDGETAMQVTAPPGTELIDALSPDRSVFVADDGTVDLALNPMQAALLVPAAEYVAGL